MAANRLGWIGLTALVAALVAAGLFLYRPSPRDPLVRRAVALLDASIENQDAFVRASAAKALGDIGGDAFTRQIEKALSDSDSTVRIFAAEAASGLPVRDAAPLLAKALGDPDPSVRLTAIRVVGRDRPELADASEVRPLIEKSARDPDLAVSLAGRATSGLDPKDGLEPFRAALSDSQPENRLTSAFALGLTRNREAVPLLAEAVTDPDPSVRGYAVKSLGDLLFPEGLPSVIRGLRDPDPSVRSLAVDALTSFPNSDFLFYLETASRDPDARVRFSVGITLLEKGDDRGSQLVERALADRDYGIRSGAVRALGELLKRKPGAMPGGRAVEIVSPLLNDPVDRVRAAATRALGMIGRPEAVPVLVAALDDPSKTVQCYAAAALIRIKNRETNPGGGPV